MPVSHKHKIILVHIPKTGGTSVEAALGMHAKKDNIGLVPYKRQSRDYHNMYGAGMQHMTLSEIKQHYSKAGFSSYESFGGLKHQADVVFDMLGVKGRENNIFNDYLKFVVVRNPYDRLVSHFSWMDGKWHKNIEPTKEEFVQFVDKMMSEKLYETDLHLIPQHQYIMVDGDIAVDKVIRIENLAEEFAVLCDELGINACLKKRMASKHKDYLFYYDDNTKEVIYDLYRKDFELFDYPR